MKENIIGALIIIIGFLLLPTFLAILLGASIGLLFLFCLMITMYCIFEFNKWIKKKNKLR